MSRQFNIKQMVELTPLNRQGFLTTMLRHQEAGAKFERLPVPPDDHSCVYCPIDPHTMRYVVKMLTIMRDATLKVAMQTPMNDAATGFYRFAHVDALDIVLASVCGEFAPELGQQLMENYE
jgi:hypothetical protein